MAALPRSPVPLWRPVKADPTRFFSPDEVARSKAYQRPLQRAAALSSALSLAVLVGFIALEVGPRIDRGAGGPWPLRLLAIIAVFSVIDEIVGFPVSAWKYRHDRQWSFETRSPATFVADRIKQTVLSTVILAAIFVPLWAVVRATTAWWLLGALVMLGVSLVLVALGPFLQRVFFKFTPMEDQALRRRLLDLARGAGARVEEILVMNASSKTKKDNAFFAGLGKTKRIVVFDNMLELGHDAVEVVVAHEIGHWRRKHLVLGIVESLVTAPFTLGVAALIVRWDTAQRWASVSSEGEPGAFPLMLLALGVPFALLTTARAWLSRWKERAGDLDSLELTGALDAYRELWHAMPARNLPDLDPSWWRRIRLTHPPVAERLAFADVWAATRRPQSADQSPPA